MASFSSTKITPANGQKIPTVDGSTTGYIVTDELKSYILADTSELEQRVDTLETEVEDLQTEVSTLKSENRVQGIKIENLEALAEGKIKVDHTEDTTDGVLDLPSGTLAPYAEVEKVMGKSEAYSIVDLGNVNWTYTNYYWYGDIQGKKAGPNATSENYSRIDTWDGFNTDPKVGTFYCNDTNERIYVNIGSSTTKPSGWLRYDGTSNTIVDSTPTEVRSKSANLLNMDAFVAKYPTRVTKQSDGSYRVSASTELFTDGIAIDVPIGYRFGMKVKLESGSNYRFRVVYADGTMSESNGSSSTDWTVIKISSATEKKAVGFRFNWSSNGTFYVKDAYAYPRDEYVPVDKGLLTLPSLTLKQGDVYDPKTGEVEEAWKKVVINGNNDGTKLGSTYSWDDTYGQTNSAGIRIFSIVNCDNRNNVYPISSFGETFNNRNSSINKEGVGTNGSGNAIFIAIKAERLSSVTTAGLNAWLASNPITIVYELSTPTTRQETPLAEPFIEAEAGGTISVISEGAQADATIHYQSQVGGTI